MCYVVFLSTSDPGDLTVNNTHLMRFGLELGSEPASELLAHPFRWFVGSRSICSCGFRHLTAPELGFNAPEEWFPEEPEDLEATAQFIAVVRALFAAGQQVDCVDAWSQTGAAQIKSLDVSISAVQDSEFRFFENHRFSFTD